MTPEDLLSKYLPTLQALESDLAGLKRETYTITAGPRDMQPEALTAAQNSIFGLRYALAYVKTTSDMAQQALDRGLVQGRENESLQAKAAAQAQAEIDERNKAEAEAAAQAGDNADS